MSDSRHEERLREMIREAKGAQKIGAPDARNPEAYSKRVDNAWKEECETNFKLLLDAVENYAHHHSLRQPYGQDVLVYLDHFAKRTLLSAASFFANSMQTLPQGLRRKHIAELAAYFMTALDELSSQVTDAADMANEEEHNASLKKN